MLRVEPTKDDEYSTECRKYLLMSSPEIVIDMSVQSQIDSRTLLGL